MKQYANLGLILLIIFLIFSILVALNLFSSIDYQATVSAQKTVPEIFTSPFSTFSILGTAEITGIFLLLILLLIVGVKRIYVAGLFVLVGLIEIAGKTFIQHEGPPIEFLKTNISVGFPSGGVSAYFFSYPSGHAARAAFISGFIIVLILTSNRLTKIQKKLLILGVIIFDFLMFLSRVYLGEHWMSDVVGGAILGFSLGFFTSYFITKKPAK